MINLLLLIIQVQMNIHFGVATTIIVIPFATTSFFGNYYTRYYNIGKFFLSISRYAIKSIIMKTPENIEQIQIFFEINYGKKGNSYLYMEINKLPVGN